MFFVIAMRIKIKFGRLREARKWKEKAPEIPCAILADSIDDPLVRMFEAVATFDIGLDENDKTLMRRAILDIEKAKSMSETLRRSAISRDKRLEELYPKSLYEVFLHDLNHIKELMEGVLLEEVTGEEVDEAVFDVDKAWKVPLWKLYHYFCILW